MRIDAVSGHAEPVAIPIVSSGWKLTPVYPQAQAADGKVWLTQMFEFLKVHALGERNVGYRKATGRGRLNRRSLLLFISAKGRLPESLLPFILRCAKNIDIVRYAVTNDTPM